jgi:NAD(P)-dependent dehydrogenase (short-subunit alcohol dehydrogenase family)
MSCAARLFGLLVAVIGLIGSCMRMPDAFLYDVSLSSALSSVGAPAETTILAANGFISVGLIITTLVRPLIGSGGAILWFALCAGRADVALPSAAAQLAQCGPSPCISVVTGANSGIGLAVSHALAKQGHEVFLGCRTSAACIAAATEITRATGNRGVHAIGGLDLASLGSVRNWVGSLMRKRARVHYLFNNAGLVPVGNTSTAEGYELGFGVSYVGHFALVHWLHRAGALPAGQATVVTVASDAARLGAFHESILSEPSGEGDLRGEHTVGCVTPFPFCLPPTPGGAAHSFRLAPTPFNFGAYTRAKLANVLFARELARKHGLHSSAVHPGTVHTPLAAHVGHQFAFFRGVRIQTESMQQLTMRAFLRPATAAAKVVVAAATAARETPGAFCNARGEVIPDELLPPAMRDDEIARRIFEVTEAAVARWEQHRQQE